MPEFLFAYHGGTTPQTREEGEKAMAAWQGWFVGMGNPVGMSKTVTAKGVADNGGTNPLSGFSVVSAGNMAEAVEMAKGCPMVVDGTGSVEVAEIHVM